MGFSEFLFGTAGDAYSDAANRQNKYNTQYQTAVGNALSPYQQLTDVNQTQGLQQQFVNGLSNLNTDQYKVNAPQYNTSSVTDADVQSLIDQNVAFQKQSAQKALESTSAGKGGLFSSGLGKSVATSDEQLSAQAYSNAYDKALTEKNRQNTIAAQQFGTNTNAGTYNLGLDTTGINAVGNAYQTMMEPMGVYSQGMMDLAGTQYGAQTGLSQQGMQNQAADTGYFGDLLNLGVTGAKSALLGA